MNTAPNRPPWWTDHMDVAGHLAREAAAQGTWPEPYLPPDRPETAPLVEALAILAGHALHRLDAIEPPADFSDGGIVGAQLAAVAAIEAAHHGDRDRVHAVLTTDHPTMRAITTTLVDIAAAMHRELNRGHEDESFRQLRAMFAENAGRDDRSGGDDV